MLNTKTIATQTARRKPVINLILAIIVSSFAFSVIPLKYENPVAMFIGFSIIIYLCVYLTMGLPSKITVDKKQKYTLSIPDHYSNINSKIPIEFITHTEVCEYKLFKKDTYYPTGVNKDYFHRKTLFGYTGAGLIICYQLPRTMTGDSIVRGIQFPAPKATDFLSLIQEKKYHTPKNVDCSNGPLQL